MPVTTTFNTISSAIMGADSLVSAIEGAITGAMDFYGLDTPINVLDVLNYLGVDTASILLGLPGVLSTEESQAIGLALVRSYQSVYQDALDGDLAVNNVLYWAQKPGASSQVQQAISTLQTVLSALSLTRTVDPFVSVVQFDPSSYPYEEQVHLGYPDGRPTAFTDPLHNVIRPNLPHYVEKPITQAIAEDLYVVQHPLYDAHISGVPWCIVKQPSAPTQTDDQANLAIYWTGQAAILAGEAVLYGYRALSSIIGALSRVDHALQAHQRVSMTQDLFLLRLIAGNAAPLASAQQMPLSDKGLIDALAPISVAENQVMATLLRDPAYIAAFDQDFSLSLSQIERYNLELAVRAQMLATRQQAAEALYNSQRTVYQQLLQEPATLSERLAVYLV